MENKVRVLYFVDNLEQGGIQQLILEIAKHINRDKVEIEILAFDDGKKYPIEETLKDMNYKIYKINGWIYKLSDYIKQAKELDKFFNKHNDYKIVHLHSSSKNYQVLKYAKKYNIPIRIAHAHNIGFQTNNKLKIFFGNILKKRLVKNTTNFFACSKDAGLWLYGKKIIDRNELVIIPNAIDIDKFKFDTEKRRIMRKKLGIRDNEILIGHVGRFVKQKNHEFLIDIFNELYKDNSRYKLILIGTGELEDTIKNKVKKLGLVSSVIFTGYQENINDYMQAMDLFLFPSLYEGLSVVLVEAQANGLCCLTSKDRVNKETDISGNLIYVSLEDGILKWKNIILQKKIERNNVVDKIKSKGFFIEDLVDRLEKVYLEI